MTLLHPPSPIGLLSACIYEHAHASEMRSYMRSTDSRPHLYTDTHTCTVPTLIIHYNNGQHVVITQHHDWGVARKRITWEESEEKQTYSRKETKREGTSDWWRKRGRESGWKREWKRRSVFVYFSSRSDSKEVIGILSISDKRWSAHLPHPSNPRIIFPAVSPNAWSRDLGMTRRLRDVCMHNSQHANPAAEMPANIYV